MSKQLNHNNNNKDGAPASENTLGEDVTCLKSVFGDVVEKVEARIKLLDEKEKHWSSLEKRMEEHASTATKKIVLDIGGQRFTTAKSTLLAYKGTFFDAMIASGKWSPDEDGTYFIDRNPELFPIILDFMRMGKVNLKKYNYDVMEDLQSELEFYQLDIPDSLLPVDTNFEGSKLLNEQFKQNLKQWIGCKGGKLLYSKSDGANAATFHQKCDKKGPTVVVIQDNNGYIFGGYTAESWDSNGITKSDPKSFLFTFTNGYGKNNYKFNPNSNNNAKITCNSGVGPGFGVDLAVQGNMSTFTSQLGNGYSDTTGNGAAVFTYGGCQIASIEVFSVR